jgi:DNA-binding NarL/FixJ family response regulator
MTRCDVPGCGGVVTPENDRMSGRVLFVCCRCAARVSEVERLRAEIERLTRIVTPRRTQSAKRFDARYREIVRRYVVEGQTSREIAHALGMSSKTQVLRVLRYVGIQPRKGRV